MGKKNKIRGGDFIGTPESLDKQLETSNLAKVKSQEKKQKRKREEKEDEYLPGDLSAKILSSARKQLEEEESEGADVLTTSKRMRHISLGNTKDGEELSEEEQDDNEKAVYDDGEIQVDPKDEAELERFMNKKDDGARKTLFDIIQMKIDEKKREAEEALSTVDPTEINIRDVDADVVAMYREIGTLLSKYRNGKIPKAFKLIPKLVNWEQILYLTNPDGWSASAMYQATRLFSSSLNARMCQRFYNLVLLPRVRDDIDEFKKLNFHLYQALHKSLFKPAAFFKGILLPLCDSGTCTLREAVIIGSVLQKASIPMFHCAAAMLKIAEMEYSGANSYFLRVLIDKKYGLPYKALDSLVEHFVRFKKDERELPVLWHHTLLALCQRYKNDLKTEQKKAILDLIKVKNHIQISAVIRFELEEESTVKI